MEQKDLSRREFLRDASKAVAAISISGGALSATQVSREDSGVEDVHKNAMADLHNSVTSDLFDIAPFGRRCIAESNNSQVAFDYQAAHRNGLVAERIAPGQYAYGLQWGEERDISEVRVLFGADIAPVEPAIEYWFGTWPYFPPQMPSIEDPADDPWQGKWLRALTKMERHGSECRYRFLPLQFEENPLADNLENLEYRRTLKLKLVFPSAPALNGVKVFTGSKQKPIQLRIQLGAGDSTPYEWRGIVRTYNGLLENVQLWNKSSGDSANTEGFWVITGASPKGLLVDLIAAEPSLAGSHDLTVVTLETAERTFSFAIADVEKGPVYVPDFRAYVTLASDKNVFAPSVVKGETIREKLAKESEQTYERAKREIPALDPSERQGPSRLYLPLAADSSWQKFAFEWGGNIMISKLGTKAKGAQLKRLEWAEDEIHWLIGTGEIPNFRPEWKNSEARILEDHLPVVTASWSTGTIQYVEEGFATLLSGPLAPDDPRRSENTPAVLLLKITCRNTAAVKATSHLWLATDEEVVFNQGELVSAVRPLVRARVRLPESARTAVADVPHNSRILHGIRTEISFAPGGQASLFIFIPFIPGLSAEERARLAGLDYDAECAKVVSYWRDATARALPFNVPEARFQTLAKANLAHIRMSVTKDPKSGLYMLPSASYLYDAFAEEIGIQAVGLDAMGDHQHAALYLESMIQLQGSKPFAGTYTGNQSGVYHGARVDKDYDYTPYQSEYNIDHGLVLWGLAEHYFFTRDKEWLNHAAPSMKKAADWIIEQRKLTQLLDSRDKIPEYGLLPAGNLEDNKDWGNWFSVNAFALAGMIRLAQALADAGAPDASHYDDEAQAYRQDIREAVLRASRLAPVTQLRNNTYIPWVPSKPHQRFRLFGPARVALYSRYLEKVYPCLRASATREVLYSPVLLLVCGVFQDDEPLASWVLDDWEDNLTTSTSLGLNVHGWVDDEYWFSRGGMVFEANIHNPILPYLRRNEIPAAIRNFYNDFVSCLYPDVNAFTEEYREWVHASGPFYKTSEELRCIYWLRLMLLLEKDDSLLLAPGVPRRWLRPGEKIDVHDAPSYFGPVSYQLQADNDGLEGTVALPIRNAYRAAWLVVRAPDGKKISSVEIDGKPFNDFDAAAERIHLPLKKEPMRISVRF
jgi:hypothetical protein